MNADVPFPTLAWFRQLAELMKEDRSLHEHLGAVDCVAQFTVTDAGPNGERWSALVTFDGFEVTEVRKAKDGDEAVADFAIEADRATWRGMIQSIREGNGRPALDQTLNFLSLPGVPLRVSSEDPVRRDMFFRFNQSLQEFFNASHRFHTVFP